MLSDRSRDWLDYNAYANRCVRCNEYFGGPKRESERMNGMFSLPNNNTKEW